MNIKEEIREEKLKSSVRGMLNLEELAAVCQHERSQKKKVVHCHGVFDLLHVGHIRYFEEAKKYGDVLVVTVTPDRFVNKGPHRPAFHDELRAEVIAALDCVDYVAINKWSSAVEVIELVRPDFYVKGMDYREAQKDHTGGIAREKHAVEATGGKLVFTDQITFSSSNLINKHLPLFSDQTNQYLSKFSSNNNANDLIQYLDNAGDLKVLVVGESIIDEYQYTEAIGKSSKEPMLALKRTSTEQFLGGILAVANHVANFSNHVGVLSFLGDRQTHERFIRSRLNDKIEPTFLYRKDSPTIMKRRFIESYFFTKLMEVYEINDGLLCERDDRILCESLKKLIPQYDIVIVVDFGHGMFSKNAIQILTREAKFLAVNAQTNAGNVGYQSITKYGRANYVCMAENEIRMEARDRRGELKEIILAFVDKRDYQRVTVTRGQNGALTYSKAEGFSEIPAFAGKVLDRMGAGDAYLSITALCVAQQASQELVGFIGNVIGAQAVATVGHRESIGRAALYKNIESLLR
jgi:rfaE bifunctional protein nucleotidyltransferase chain/domain